jgi:hypothetical protein
MQARSLYDGFLLSFGKDCVTCKPLLGVLGPLTRPDLKKRPNKDFGLPLGA